MPQTDDSDPDMPIRRHTRRRGVPLPLLVGGGILAGLVVLCAGAGLVFLLAGKGGKELTAGSYQQIESDFAANPGEADRSHIGKDFVFDARVVATIEHDHAIVSLPGDVYGSVELDPRKRESLVTGKTYRFRATLWHFKPKNGEGILGRAEMHFKNGTVR